MIDNCPDFANIIPSFFHMSNRYCNSSWYVPPALRNFHNFMLIVSGEGTSMTDGNEFRMSPGMLVYHHPGQSFGFTTSQTDFMHCFGVNFHLASASSDSDGNWTFGTVDKLPFDNIVHIPNMDLLIKYFTDLTDVWEESKRNHPMKCRSIFLNILYEISNQMMLKQGNVKITQGMEFVISYIRKHYSERLTLESLAELINLNPNYFSGTFKKYTGKSPMEYINSVRVERAEEYLGIGYSITETSTIVGFSDPFYFSKVFKKFKGVCPREYIKTPINFC